MYLWACVSVCVYLLIATVRASGELAQGHMTSDLRPLDWKTLRKASQDEMDPGGDAGRSKQGPSLAFLLRLLTSALSFVCQGAFGERQVTALGLTVLTGIGTISHHQHAQRAEVDVSLVPVSDQGPVHVP